MSAANASESAASGRPLRLLLVEDSPYDEALLLESLRAGGFTVTHRRVETEPAMREALAAEQWDVVISDYSMPQFSGLGAIKVLKETGFDVPLLIVSGTINEESAVEALKAGASDFLVKDRLARLVPAVEREIREAAGREARRASEQTLAGLEEQLRQAQRLESIGGLAAGMAHDFNNLLTIVSGYCGLLSERFESDPSALADLTEIQRAATSAASLTRQLLAFSRKQILAPAVVDLHSIIDGTSRMLERLVEEDVRIVIRCADEPMLINVDAGQIEQVLLNLAVNARDAMPNGGVLTIETAAVRIDATAMPLPPGDYARLSVSDTGTGMSPEVKARLFEPFFTTKERGRGTGLGLATVYGIVAQSGGHIAIHSEEGAGSRFDVHLPLTAAPAAVAPAAAGGSERAAPAAAGKTILVVEDEPAIRNLTELVLRRAGYTMLVADSGEHARKLCDRHEGDIDVVLCDVVMPDGGGGTVGEYFKRSRPDAKLVYMSGYTDQVIAQRGVLAPDVVFLQKPFTPASLIAKIRAVLES